MKVAPHTLKTQALLDEDGEVVALAAASFPLTDAQYRFTGAWVVVVVDASGLTPMSVEVAAGGEAEAARMALEAYGRWLRQPAPALPVGEAVRA